MLNLDLKHLIILKENFEKIVNKFPVYIYPPVSNCLNCDNKIIFDKTRFQKSCTYFTEKIKNSITCNGHCTHCNINYSTDYYITHNTQQKYLYQKNVAITLIQTSSVTSFDSNLIRNFELSHFKNSISFIGFVDVYNMISSNCSESRNLNRLRLSEAWYTFILRKNLIYVLNSYNYFKTSEIDEIIIKSFNSIKIF